MEHFGRAVANGFSCALVVADPSHNALSVAKESAELVKQLGIKEIILVINRIDNPADVDKIREKLDWFAGFFRMIFLPFNPEIIPLEPSVNRLLSRESAFMHEIHALAVTVTGPEKISSSDILR